MPLFGRRRAVLDHPYFGRVMFMSRSYWEGELSVPGQPEKVGLVIPAPESGPLEEQVEFCRGLLTDLDALFARCRPVFKGDFEVWTEKPFPVGWHEDFLLVGLGLPELGDETKPWDVCYFVDAANHYFTAYFEEGRPSYLSIDG
jgi:hypothetical protein